MFPQYHMIRDFDIYEQDYQEFTKFSAPVFHKQDFLKQTQENELETDNKILLTRSLKSKSSSIETSFQHTLMEQHLLAFKKTLQKYMEKCHPNLKKVQRKFLGSDILQMDEYQSLGQEKLKRLIIKDSKLFEEKEKKQFLTDLFYEQKLNEFLLNICNTTHSLFSLELIFIANRFWQAYIPKQQIGLSEAQIKKLVDQLLDSQSSIEYLQKIQYLNFKRSSMTSELSEEQINENLKMFIRQFGNTVLLVIEEYFKNPYSKDDEDNLEMKRPFSFKDISNDQFSDDEDQINFSVGHKKRKL